MKLMIGPNINNNKVRLDFRNSPDKPNNVPSYEIDNTKADEFVRQYNSQSDKLHKMTNTIMGISGIIGGIGAAKIVLGMGKNKLLKCIASVVASLSLGAIISTVISSNMKNKLMDEYDVHKHQYNE